MFKTYEAFSRNGERHPSHVVSARVLLESAAPRPPPDECRALLCEQLRGSDAADVADSDSDSAASGGAHKIAPPISDVQSDAVVLAAAQHKQNRSFLCADNTGMGKGRVAMAAAFNWCDVSGVRKVLYLSVANVFPDAERDHRDLGVFKAFGMGCTDVRGRAQLQCAQ